jgi:hypothetical protein
MGQQVNGFVDVAMVGVDKNRTQNPNPNKLLYDVYLEMSTTPPSMWANILEEEHRFPRISLWRRARVEGKYIVVHCPLNEVADHLEYLKEDVKNANIKYLEWLEKELARQRDLAERKANEEKRKNDLLDSLDFD